HLEVPEFGIRDESTVDEQSAADAGSQGEQQNGSGHTACGAVLELGDAGRIGVVDGRHGALQPLGGELRQRLTDPCLVEIRSGPHRAVADDAWESQSYREIAGNVRDDLP